ncbi:unnamed protein product [Owenia fusiformis]|uniref:Cadherin domain-containing protein n=1 Tax=Owenia fusiformis TaxID=6347 RepID=A0A8S4QAQ4_OWEFU|nr:unnamed protein product [Owenia fusiformis]
MYSIITGNINGDFAIDSTTGAIRTVNTLDFETMSGYALTIQAEDQGVPKKSILVNAFINILNVNENEPDFTPSDIYNAAISEGANYGDVILTVGATDADGDEVSFTVIAGDPSGMFNIDSTSGVIRLLGTLDRETLPSFTLKVEAKDSHGLVSQATVNISITDENDNSPICSPSSITKYIEEDEAVMASIASLTCLDADLGVNQELLYVIDGGNTERKFAINAITGVINLVNSLDFESTKVYSLDVAITDTGQGRRKV